jgi:hypothetical protein
MKNHFRSNVNRILIVTMLLRIHSETAAEHLLTRIGDGRARAFVMPSRVELRAPNIQLPTLYTPPP